LLLGFDVDETALWLSQKNAAERGVLNRCDFILCDIKNINRFVQLKQFDTVIMNPPFGTIEKGADLIFLKMAINLAKTAVYSLHKTSTRKFIISEARKWGISSKVIAELKFNLPASYKFHKKNSVDIRVDLIRFLISPRVNNF